LHYIEKQWGGQARKTIFSLWDKELAHLVNAKQICLKSNELQDQAKVVCNEGRSNRAIYARFEPEANRTEKMRRGEASR
jgi:hypothetical protein